MVTGADIVAQAEREIGDPYVWAAEGPDAFDCSGLVEYVYKQLGLTTPRTTAAMMSSPNLQPIQRTDLQAGDLIFSNWTGRPSSHVGIYDGRGGLIEAPAPGEKVKVTQLGAGYWSHVDAIRRVPGVDGYSNIRGQWHADPDGLSIPGLVGKVFAAPSNVTEALTNVGAGLAGVAQGAANMGKLADLTTKLFLPSNALRAFCMLLGLIFILIGIGFLGKEIRQ